MNNEESSVMKKNKKETRKVTRVIFDIMYTLLREIVRSKKIIKLIAPVAGNASCILQCACRSHPEVVLIPRTIHALIFPALINDAVIGESVR